MSTTGDVAAIVAALASSITLGTSIYIVRFQGRTAARLDLAKWSRDHWTGVTDEVLGACMQIAPQEGYELDIDYVATANMAAEKLSPLLYAASDPLSRAALELQHTLRAYAKETSAMIVSEADTQTPVRNTNTQGLVRATVVFAQAVRAEFGIGQK
jgi:hypothetical protein